MPPRADNAAFRDVLMFEERLKTTAALLQRRKARYQFFLFQLLLVIALLAWEVLLPPEASVLVIPYRLLLQQVFALDSQNASKVVIHPFITSGMLFVGVTTLVLFFASGMYREKIAYANKYVPHANRALRSFNMVLNVRKPPLRSKFAWNPLNFFFPRPHAPNSTTTPSSPQAKGQRLRSPSVSRPLSTLPPTSNPRGELVFSSKVDRTFREGYDRYRAAFERKRTEKLRQERLQKWYWRLAYTLTSLPSLTYTVLSKPSALLSRKALVATAPWGDADKDREDLAPESASSTSTQGGDVGTRRSASTTRGRGGTPGSRSATPPSTPGTPSSGPGQQLMMRRSRTPITPSSSPSPPSTPTRERERERESSSRPSTPSRRGRRRLEREGSESSPGMSMRALALEKSFEMGQSQSQGW